MFYQQLQPLRADEVPMDVQVGALRLWSEIVHAGIGHNHDVVVAAIPSSSQSWDTAVIYFLVVLCLLDSTAAYIPIDNDGTYQRLHLAIHQLVQKGTSFSGLLGRAIYHEVMPEDVLRRFRGVGPVARGSSSYGY